MGSQQQFCLRWNNHQGNLVTVFDSLLTDNLLVDVTLACEGASLKAHKVVLSACSSFFQEIFVNNPCKHPVIILKDMKFSEMKAILQFMYKGEVNVSQDQLSALLKTAESLKVKGLAEVTSEQQDTQNIPQKRTVNQEHSNASYPPKQSNIYQPVPQRRQQVQSHVPVDNGSSSSLHGPTRRRRRMRSPSPPEIIASSPKHIKEQPKSPIDVEQSQESQMMSVPDVYTNQPIPVSDPSMPDTLTFQSEVEHVDPSMSPEPEIVHIKEAPQSPPPESSHESVLPLSYMDQHLGTSEMEGNHHADINSDSITDNVLEKDTITFEEEDSSMYPDEAAMMAQYDDDGSQSGMISYLDPGPSTSQGGIQASNTGTDKSSTELISGTSLENYQCPVCKKVFTQIQYVKRHRMAVHEKVKFPCPVCEKEYCSKGDMKRHYTSIHEKIRFQCDMCQKTFCRKHHVQKHRKSVHNINEDHKLVKSTSDVHFQVHL